MPDVRTHDSRTTNPWALALGTLATIAVLVSVGIYQLRPPTGLPGEAPKDEFSATRAFQHLQVIARRPRPVGSAENARVRGYLLAQLDRMGLRTEVQSSGASREVHNVVATLPGTDPTGKSLVLMAHYDSVPNGPGASDDGASVAAILETVRAIRAGPPLENDLIFLLTDGEEPGLFGSKAFVAGQPAVRDVGVVLNFEARGSSGASLMFETSEDNGWLIRQFARCAPYAVTSSLMGDVYRRLPNDTDFTSFKEAGYSGLNFAYIGGSSTYYTPQDTIENVSRKSLQHQGSYALALGRRFGNVELDDTTESDAVYFSLFGSVVHYPVAWVAPLTFAAFLGWVLILLLGLRQGRLSLPGVGMGFLASLAVLLCGSLAATVTWFVFRALRAAPDQGTYGSHLYAIALVSMAVAVCALLWPQFRAMVGLDDRAAGGLLLWLFPLVLSSVYLPGGSYLFLWPLLAGLSALLLDLLDDYLGKRWLMLPGLLLPAAVTAIVYVPIIYLSFVALPVASYGVIAALAVLPVGVLAPHLDLLVTPNRFWFPGLALVPALGLLAWSALAISA